MEVNRGKYWNFIFFLVVPTQKRRRKHTGYTRLCVYTHVKTPHFNLKENRIPHVLHHWQEQAGLEEWAQHHGSATATLFLYFNKLFDVLPEDLNHAGVSVHT